MNGRRLGALVVAAILVAAAFVVRRVFLDDDPSVASPTDDAGPVGTSGDEGRATDTVVCVAELVEVCDDLEARYPDLQFRTEDAGTTLDALAALEDPAAAPLWITVEPFPAMVDELRAVADVEAVGFTTEAIASSPLALATPADGRAAVLDAACPGGDLWRCAGQQAGAPWTELAGGEAAWGDVRPSVGRVDRSAAALAGFAAAVGGYLGTADFSRSTWEADPSFTAWVRRLVRAVPVESLSGGTPLATMATRPAVDVAATSDAELAGLGGTDRFDVRYPQPAMWLEAVIAAPAGAAVPDGFSSSAADAALAAWAAPEGATTALPSATTMVALRQLWEDAS